MTKVGQIIRLQTESRPGVLISEAQRYPYISDQNWEIGDWVQFETEKIILDGEEVEVAYNLTSYGMLENFKTLDNPPSFNTEEPWHKSGHVNNPIPNYTAPSGYSPIWIGGILYSISGNGSIAPGTLVFFDDNGGTHPIRTPNGTITYVRVINYLTLWNHH